MSNFYQTQLCILEFTFPNNVRHLMTLKEVNAKEAPELTQEEMISVQDLDDAFVLAQTENDAVYNLIKDLETSQTEACAQLRHHALMFILDQMNFTL